MVATMLQELLVAIAIGTSNSKKTSFKISSKHTLLCLILWIFHLCHLNDPIMRKTHDLVFNIHLILFTNIISKLLLQLPATYSVLEIVLQELQIVN